MSPDEIPPAASDAALVSAAQQGDRAALEELIRRYQSWVYNIALRMVWSPEEAQDITQEVLIKVVTKLSTFRGESAFRTWLYRIAVNHVLNMKKRGSELSVLSFEEYAARINRCPDDLVPGPGEFAVAPEALVQESKLACMTGMLLCLDREQRLVLILGAIFELDSKVAAEILDITADNFRQKLSRARRDLSQFMNNQCGLVNPDNPCRCAKKTKGFIRAGVVDPQHLRFYDAHVQTVKEAVGQKSEDLEQWIELFLQHPFPNGPDFVGFFRSAIQQGDFGTALSHSARESAPSGEKSAG